MKGVDKDSHLVSRKPCVSSSVLADRGVWGSGLGALCIDRHMCTGRAPGEARRTQIEKKTYEVKGPITRHRSQVPQDSGVASSSQRSPLEGNGKGAIFTG